MGQWAAIQPKDGDCILHCGHPDIRSVVFFQCQPPLGFQRPDGTVGKATWLVACGPCLNDAGGEIMRVKFRGDGEWKGNEPVILAGS